jgi:hypothetical protein
MEQNVIANISEITNPVTKSKLVEIKEDGEVVDRTLVTTVSFDYEGSPAAMDKVLWMLKAGHAVSISFVSLQSTLDSVTISGGGKSVTFGKKEKELVESSP